MKKYTTFSEGANAVILLTASIVGFRNWPQVYGCFVILESGQEVRLDRFSVDEAQKVFERSCDEKEVGEI